VPAPYLAQVRQLLEGSVVELGAQDVSRHEQGAYTGEVSAAMLGDFAVRYCLVGHSERRQYHGETDAVVAAKAQRLLAHGITPIVCVGETLAEREAAQTQAVVARQLGAVLDQVGVDAERIVVAYEPVWPSAPAARPRRRKRSRCTPACARNWPPRRHRPRRCRCSMAAA